jgi:hypothetical protein
MSTRRSLASPRKRRRWLWLGVLPASLLTGVLVVRSMLEPERLSAFLLQQGEIATGLDLALSEPADVGFWPDLHLQLSGLTATAAGAGAPLLRVERIDAVLPWSALSADTLQLRSLRLHAPALDVAAFENWIDARADVGPPPPLRLPQLDAAMQVEQGSVVAKGWRIADLALELTALRNGEPSVLALAGKFVREGHAPQPYDLRIKATPHQRGDELHLDPIALAAHSPGEASPWLQLAGTLALPPPSQLRIALTGTMPQWPSSWSALPLPPASGDEGVSIALDYSGSTGLQGALALRIARGDEALQGDLQLGDLFAWSAEPDAIPLPPLRGAIQSARLQFDGVELRGVRLRFEEAGEGAGSDDATP